MNVLPETFCLFPLKSYLCLSVVGLKRVKVLMKRGGTQIMEHMKKMIEKSKVVDEQTQEEKGEPPVFLFYGFFWFK